MSDLKATCAITGKEFTISEQEQELRAKFGLADIPPQIAPLERWRACLAQRARHGLWKNKCVVSGRELLSNYPRSSIFPVIDKGIMDSDQFVGTNYGREIDWERPLLDQWWELWTTVPRSHQAKVNNENCDFANNANDCKDCYYSFGLASDENMYYVDGAWESRDCLDCLHIKNVELCYHCVHCKEQCYQCGYCYSCKGCTDCLGCVDCRSCQNCLLCSGLEHQKYCYLNEQLSEEEYAVKLNEYKSDWSRLKQEYAKIQSNYPVTTNVNAEDSRGHYLINTHQCRDCYNVTDSENLQNCKGLSYAKDCLDCVQFGGQMELCINCHGSGSQVYNLCGCVICFSGVRDLVYCAHCTGGIADCALSISLNKRERYCILNKQYTEEEYKELLPRVIAKMKEEGWYGHPLPASWGGLPYNYSFAGDLLPLTKEEVEGRGLRWADPEDMVAAEGAEIAGDQIVTSEDVTKLNGKILKCERTGRPFKLIAAELNLYAKHGLPLPKLHPDERYRDRVKQTVSLESVFN